MGMNRSQRLRSLEADQKERHDVADAGDRHAIVLRPVQVAGELLAAGAILTSAELARFKPGNLAALVTGRRIELRPGPATAGPASKQTKE